MTTKNKLKPFIDLNYQINDYNSFRFILNYQKVIRVGGLVLISANKRFDK